MINKNPTDEFLELYKQLEEIAVKRFGFPEDGKAIYYLSKRDDFKSVSSELDYCREVRNLLQHKRKLGDSYAVIPSENMLNLIRNTIFKVNNPPLAKNIAIRHPAIFYRSMNDYVRPAMLEMQSKNYTHIPILENGIVVGVFSDNTAFSYLLEDDVVGIESTKKFSDLRNYLPINKHSSESFYFVKPTVTVDYVKNLFEKSLSKQERIGLVFLTNTGKETDPLYGIISPWDVAGK